VSYQHSFRQALSRLEKDDGRDYSWDVADETEWQPARLAAYRCSNTAGPGFEARRYLFPQEDAYLYQKCSLVQDINVDSDPLLF
jgi:hypothetical protein